MRAAAPSRADVDGLVWRARPTSVTRWRAIVWLGALATVGPWPARSSASAPPSSARAGASGTARRPAAPRVRRRGRSAPAASRSCLPPDPRASESTPTRLLDAARRAVLAGGADVDPSTYGAEPHAARPSARARERDTLRARAGRARDRARPARASASAAGCRSSTSRAAARCIQHLPDAIGHDEHRRTLGSFDGADHDVAPGDGLAGRAGRGRGRARDEVPPPPGRRPHRRRAGGHRAASALDELPEALEMPGRRFVLGVQWHPEADDASQVISAFVRAAGACPPPRPAAAPSA